MTTIVQRAMEKLVGLELETPGRFATWTTARCDKLFQTRPSKGLNPKP